MPQITQNFSGAKMNKDLDERIVPKGQYRDALNIKISTTDSDAGGLGNVGTVQNIQGNRLVTTTSTTTYDGKTSKIIASIADEGTNKAYFFTAAPVPRLGGIEGIPVANITTEIVWIDSIFEVTSVGDSNSINDGAIFVDRFAVTNTKAGVFTTSSGDIVNGSTYKSNGSFESTPANGYDQLQVLDGTKYRVGMRIYAVDTNNVNLLSDGNNDYVEIVRIQSNVLTLAQEQTVDLNTAVALKFIHPERVLEFDYYTGDVFDTISLIPTASIDVLDNLLMWTDGKHEPKKINIERSRAGTTDLTTHTKLYVNAPGTDNPEVISDFEYVDFAGLSTDVKREHITVIKKAPTSPPNIEISNKDRDQDADCPIQFLFIQTTDEGSPDYEVVPSIGTIKLIDFPDIISPRVDDIYSFVASNVVEPITVRVKITDIDDANPSLATVEILFADSDLTVQTNPNNWIVNLETKRPFFETKFGRFGYRYQYEDNEYSTFSPWSDLAFLPGDFSYTPSKGFNEGMSNTARKIIVRDWLPTNYTRPLDVKTVDILWKTTDDGNVYIVKSIKRGIDTEWIDMVDNDNLSNTGEFTITSEMIHKVVESNQLLRAWDNVPRYAKAQTITSNRLVYGNYTQGYNLDANIGLLQTVVSKKGLFPTAQKSVKSIRNYQFGVVLGDKYGRETPVISNGYKSAEGQVMPGASKVLKSLSSYSNKFKIKQSWTNSNPTRMPWMEYVKYYVKETSNEYYNLVLDRIYDAGDDNIWLAFNSADRNKVDEETYLVLKNEHGSQTPVDEDARYKIIAISGDAPDYIKTDEREFDLIQIDSVNVYGGNWPNTMNDDLVAITDAVPARLINFKSIRTNNGATDTLSELEFKGTPKVRIVAQFTDSQGDLYEAKSPLRTVSGMISEEEGAPGVSIREVFTLSDVNMYQRILTQLPDATELPIAGADENSNFIYYIQLVDAVVENKPQFDGKFFVKIAKDNTLEARVLGNSLGEYQTLNTYELAFISDDLKNPAYHPGMEYAAAPGMDYEDSDWETIGNFTSSNIAGETGGLPNFINLNSNSDSTDSFWTAWSNNTNRTADIFIDSAPAYSGFDSDVADLGNFNLFDSYSAVDGDTSFNPRGLSNGEFIDGTEGQFIFSVIGPDGFSGTNSYFKSKMQTPGTLFKFRDDPNQEVYTVRGNFGQGGQDSVGPITIESKNFDNDGSSIYVDRTSIIVRFARVGLNGRPVLPLTGLDTSVWDPRGTVKHNGLTSMTIDFVQRVPVGSLSDDSIETSAACFETEPKEDVGLDIYYEASGAIPVRLKLDNIIPFTNANKIRERAGGFGVESRQVTNNNNSIEVNLTNNPYVFQAIDDDNVFIKRRVNGANIALKTIITDGVSDGVCPAIGDIVRFEHKSGLVTKSKILDHSKILTTPIAVPSDRYTISGLGILIGDANTPAMIQIAVGVANASSVAVGMEVTGTGVDSGTFIKSIANDGVNYNITLSQQLISAGTNNYTFIDITGIFKIEKEVWKYSVELGWFNCYSFGNGVESDRIRDDFNAPQIDNGIKVSSTFLNYGEEKKTSGMIFSGLYNSTSGVNNLNQFNMAEKITKDINTTYGSLQAMIARDNDVVVFAEDKVMRVQSGGKDALFNADGNPQLTATNKVLGTTMPFTGDYGISKNPESLATDNYRMYFTDTQRGAVLRLSNNGITPISDAGMKNYFRENLKYYINITGSVNGVDDEFNITLHDTSKFSGFGSKTISFSESGKGWVSFKSFTPLATANLNDKYYSVKDNAIWVHHDDTALRNNFYGTQYSSVITLLFNDAPGSIKSFKNINYEGSQAKVAEFTTQSAEDAAGNIFTVNDGEYYNLNSKPGWYVSDITTDKQSGSVHEFIEKEGKWFNYINGDTTTDSNLDTSEFSVQGIGFPLVNPTDTQTLASPTIGAVDADGETL